MHSPAEETHLGQEPVQNRIDVVGGGPEFADAIGNQKLCVLDQVTPLTLAIVLARGTLVRAGECLDAREPLDAELSAQPLVLSLVTVDVVEGDEGGEGGSSGCVLRREILAVSTPKLSVQERACHLATTYQGATKATN